MGREEGLRKQREMRPPAQNELEREVIKEELCTLCGACTGMCPYFLAHQGRIVARDECNLAQGRCRDFCPRVSVDLDLLHRSVFGGSYQWDSLGHMEAVCMARSTSRVVRSKAQYGGVVSTLMSFALREGTIDSAVMTRVNVDGEPEGVCARSSRDVLTCSGSTYVASPTVGAFNTAVRTGRGQRIGVVGTPCQVLALSKMKVAVSDDGDASRKLGLVVGLFCTWSLSWEGFLPFLAGKVKLADIMKVDIPPPPANILEVHARRGRLSIPLDDVRQFIRPGCTYCTDMTAEFADISVGAAEGIEGWNTVVVRTEKGAEVLAKATSRKLLEVRPLPGGNLEHLKKASDLKKRRALKTIIGKTGKSGDLLYLVDNRQSVKEFLHE
jgi:coenzyme F420 hydrogenase subunit beta